MAEDSAHDLNQDDEEAERRRRAASRRMKSLRETEHGLEVGEEEDVPEADPEEVIDGSYRVDSEDAGSRRAPAGSAAVVPAAGGGSGGGREGGETPGSDGHGRSDGDDGADTSPDDALVHEYLEQIALWDGGTEFANDAELIDKVKKDRIKLTRELARRGLLAHGDLRGVSEYLRQDLAYISRPAPGDEDYASFVKRRAELRDQIFGDETQVGAESYANAAMRTQNMIIAGTHIDDQYDLIELRREAALEHFDDPRFVAEIGLHGGKLLDELLIDFDRSDLKGSVNRARSRETASVFFDMIDRRPRTRDGVAAQVKSFMELREAGIQIRHNQQAIVDFAASTRPGSREYQIGMAALDNTHYSFAALTDFVEGFPPGPERQAAVAQMKTPVAMFRLARRRFEKQLHEGDPGVGVSFAIMEEAARHILPSERHVAALTERSLEDASALFMFSDEAVRDTIAPVAGRFEATVIAKMHQAGSLKTEGERAASATVEDNDGNSHVLSFMQSGEPLEILAVDGGRVRIARTAEDMEKGLFIETRLAGVMAPRPGQQSGNGKIDAGEEARSHLQEVLNRHGTTGLGLHLVKTEGETRAVEITLPTGESLSQRLIRDGYAKPTKDVEGGLRREYLAKQAEANRRGLWREGFPEMDESWRSENETPNLSASDKRQNLLNTVSLSLSGSHADVFRKLSHKETRLFALPVEKWSAMSGVDREILRVAKTNPARLQTIYANNMAILRELRERKDKLTEPEKLAHDQLSLGRRALAQALVETGHMTLEQAQKDGHPLMSRKALRLDPKYLRTLYEGGAKAVEKTVELAEQGARKGARFLNSMLDFAQDVR